MRLSSRFILDNLFLLTAAFLVIAGISAVLTTKNAHKLSHALADLTAHEATTEKVVHQLVVHDGTLPAEQRHAA